MFGANVNIFTIELHNRHYRWISSGRPRRFAAAVAATVAAASGGGTVAAAAAASEGEAAQLPVALLQLPLTLSLLDGRLPLGDIAPMILE